MKRARDLLRAGFVSSALLLASLYAAELSACLAGLALYKRGERSLSEFSTSPAGLMFGVSAVACVSALLIAAVLALRGRERGQRVGAVLGYNLWTLALSAV